MYNKILLVKTFLYKIFLCIWLLKIWSIKFSYIICFSYLEAILLSNFIKNNNILFKNKESVSPVVQQTEVLHEFLEIRITALINFVVTDKNKIYFLNYLVLKVFEYNIYANYLITVLFYNIKKLYVN